MLLYSAEFLFRSGRTIFNELSMLYLDHLYYTLQAGDILVSSGSGLEVSSPEYQCWTNFQIRHGRTLALSIPFSEIMSLLLTLPTPMCPTIFQTPLGEK
ncbi:hypothetical protein ADUPG1_000201 [Aduncisulcus paluster]|uniref:Uncharacterized protein n=1 Tax=Aduncisulcus paluster TaxID=2918883 RepID=A0ABQ5K5E8_9EUKA|nr:hypothetical protein ADUPG1_000201 [Aduncisulcus paluster]